MSEHLSQSDFDGFGARTLAPEDLLRVDDHLATCAACRERASAGSRDRVDGLRADLAADARPGLDHLSAETLSGFVGGRLDDVELEIAQSHLDVCEPCAAEERQLRQFAAGLARNRVTTGWFARNARPSWLGLAAAAAVVLAVAAIGWFALGRSSPDNGNQLANRNSPSNGNGRPDIAVTPAPGPPDPGTNGNTAIPRVTNDQPESGPIVVAEVTIAEDSGTVHLRPDGRLEGLEHLTSSQQSDVARALSTGVLPVGNVSDVAGRRGTLMGQPSPSDPLVPRTPVGTLVLTDRPTFRWTSVAAATAYRVEVYDENLARVTGSGPLTGTIWTPSEALPPAKVLTWQVVATTPDGDLVAPKPPASEARFRILAPEVAAAITDEVDRTGGSHLAAAVVYARAGLLDDAERELDALESSNAGSSVTRRLRASLRSARAR